MQVLLQILGRMVVSLVRQERFQRQDLFAFNAQQDFIQINRQVSALFVPVIHILRLGLHHALIALQVQFQE